MKYIYFSILVLLFSCGTKDTKICDCLVAGESLNKFSAKMMLKDANSADLKEMTKLKENKRKKCAAYEAMSGEEMLKLKANCSK
jgi:hypothetical protein